MATYTYEDVLHVRRFLEMRGLSLFFSFLLVPCICAHASDMALYVGHPNTDEWYDELTMLEDASNIVNTLKHLFREIRKFNDDQLEEFKAWARANMSDGELDIIWLNGCMPSVLYPNPNVKPDCSLAEEWLDNGNMFINVGDWFGYCTYETGERGAENGPEGAANILDLPAEVIIFSPGDQMKITPTGKSYMPSIEDFVTDRPINLSQVQYPWTVAAIFGSTSGTEDVNKASLADPVVIYNTQTRGYVAFINQSTKWIDRGRATIEFINNWVMRGQKTVSIEVEQRVSKGRSFSAAINVEDINDLAGFQLDIAFDPAILEAVGVEEGTLLSGSGGTLWLESSVDNDAGVITGIVCAKTGQGGVDGSGTLVTITFTAIDIGESYISLQNIKLSDSSGAAIAATPSYCSVTVFPCWDVNKDGRVDIFDLVLVGQHFGEDVTIPLDPNPDANDDGKVDVFDLVLVGQHFGEVYLSATPSRDIWSFNAKYLPVLIAMRNIMEDNPSSDPGFLTTKRLLHKLIFNARIAKTEVFQNYPNPFNPETWIPYQLAEDSEVNIRIYSMTGQLIRLLELGCKEAGLYLTRGAAAHWDGRTDAGERVFSGVYFYNVQAGDYNATKKMTVAQ